MNFVVTGKTTFLIVHQKTRPIPHLRLTVRWNHVPHPQQIQRHPTSMFISRTKSTRSNKRRLTTSSPHQPTSRLLTPRTIRQQITKWRINSLRILNWICVWKKRKKFTEIMWLCYWPLVLTITWPQFLLL